MINILIVDNNAKYASTISRILEKQPDMEVAGVVGSLGAARRMLEGVDVALVDRGLPDGDGFGLIGEVRAASPDAKDLVMSATAEMRHPQEALEAGANRVMDKMETPEEVFALIRDRPHKGA
jgi:DNA-binding NarL/FixJ family response regulator